MSPPKRTAHAPKATVAADSVQTTVPLRDKSEAPQWLYTPQGQRRGYIESRRLTELWFHTGTNCNLACRFCYEGSKPGDRRIEAISLDDVKPFIAEALELGVERLAFTGGEPFVNRHFLEILDFSLDHLPCLVLTNGTKPVRKRFHEIVKLREKPHTLSFRVSLDHPDPKKHDQFRGLGNFRTAMESLGMLHAAGFPVSIARLAVPDEDSAAIDRSYEPIFRQAGLPPNVPIVRFSDFLRPGSIADVPHITENCMTTYTTSEQRAEYMCAYGRMIVKKSGNVRVYACTLVDDDEDFDLGGTLKESVQIRVRLKHHRCYSCFAFGSSCSGPRYP